MKKPFQVGDRVAVYGLMERYATPGAINTVSCRTACTVENMDGLLAGVILVKHEGCTYMVNPKQCRRLRPKKRRRVWVSEANVGHVMAAKYGETVHIWNTAPSFDGVVEFVEVKRES